MAPYILSSLPFFGKEGRLLIKSEEGTGPASLGTCCGSGTWRCRRGVSEGGTASKPRRGLSSSLAPWVVKADSMKRGGISAASSRSGGEIVGIVLRLRSGGRMEGRVDGAVHGARVAMKRLAEGREKRFVEVRRCVCMWSETFLIRRWEMI